MNIRQDGIIQKLMNGFSLGLIHDLLEGFWAEIVNGLNSALLPWYWNVPEQGSLSPYLFVTQQQRPLRLIAEDVAIADHEWGMLGTRLYCEKTVKNITGTNENHMIEHKIGLNTFYGWVHVWRHMCFSKISHWFPAAFREGCATVALSVAAFI